MNRIIRPYPQRFEIDLILKGLNELLDGISSAIDTENIGRCQILAAF
jgi:hypothetical protein